MLFMALVAEDGVEPPTEAYETSEIPFLYSAIISVGYVFHVAPT